jgi:two-component system, OmpR family, alkaline phosphatase synthesis response regulator PhoP
MPGRVMIFDDDADLIEVCSIVLKSKNYEVRGRYSCHDILNEVLIFSPQVILMDNRIPVAGGVKASLEIKNDIRLKSIPVIFISANERVRELAAEAGADFFLKKPFEIEELEAVLCKAILIHDRIVNEAASAPL